MAYYGLDRDFNKFDELNTFYGTTARIFFKRFS